MAEKQLKSLKFYGLDDVYIIPKMYISDPSKNGNVKICFGIPSTEPTLISFTINGTTYQAEEGMTWEEWVNSSYNTRTFVIQDDYVRSRDDGPTVGYSRDNPVSPTGIIEPDVSYITYLAYD